MKQFFQDSRERKSMMRLLAFGCFITGSIVAILGVALKQSEAVWAGTGLAAVGIAGKYGQKRTEENGK